MQRLVRVFRVNHLSVNNKFMKPKLIKRGEIWLCICGKKFAAARTPSEAYMEFIYRFR